MIDGAGTSLERPTDYPSLEGYEAALVAVILLMVKFRVDCNWNQEITVYKTNHPSLNELLLDIFNPQIMVFI